MEKAASSAKASTAAPTSQEASSPAPASSSAEQPKAEAKQLKADAAGLVAPLAVAAGIPSADPNKNQAKLIVTKGGVRSANGSVAPLAGATFSFWYTGTSSAVIGGTKVGTCTTDALGSCGVIVPLVDGSWWESDNNYFYAKEDSAPGGWSVADTWGGSSDYFRQSTGAITSGGNVSSRVKTLPSDTARTIPNVMNNPAAPQKCGINMAVVYDLSGSVTDNSTLLPKYKAAGVKFVDALTGTPSSVALHTFASQAPAQNSKGKTNNTTLALTSVAQAAGATTVKNKINGYDKSEASTAQGTNWDAGLSQVGAGYDVVLFLTDGDPTWRGTGSSSTNDGSGTTTTVRKVEEAIYSANKVKATGAKVIAVGIGGSVDTAAGKQRLKLISGSVENSDFFVTGFDQLGTKLTELATANCQGTVTVVKSIQGGDGKITPGSNWTFASSTTQVAAGTGTSASGTTDANGALNFKVQGYTSSVTTRNVAIAEIQQTGYALVQQNGANAKCTNVGTGANVPVGTNTALGFTVDVPKTAVISCSVINKKLSADVSIVKAAPAYNGGNPVTGPGTAPDVPAGTIVTWNYTVKNTGSVPLTNVKVVDDKVTSMSCPKTTLAVSESMTCTASGAVTAQN